MGWFSESDVKAEKKFWEGDLSLQDAMRAAGVDFSPGGSSLKDGVKKLAMAYRDERIKCLDLLMDNYWLRESSSGNSWICPSCGRGVRGDVKYCECGK